MGTYRKYTIVCISAHAYEIHERQYKQYARNHRRRPARQSWPKESHVHSHNSPRKDSAADAEIPHRRDRTIIKNDHIGIRVTADDARVAVAVVEDIGELEARQEDQPCLVDELHAGGSPAGFPRSGQRLSRC